MAIFPTQHIQTAKEITNYSTLLVTMLSFVTVFFTLCNVFKVSLCDSMYQNFALHYFSKNIVLYVRLSEGRCLDHLQTLSLQILLLWTFFCRYLCVHMFFCLLYIPRNRVGKSVWHLEELCNCLTKSTSFYVLISKIREDPNYQHLWQLVLVFWFLRS